MPHADAPTSDKPLKPKRRWFQFSLRALLILTTVIAVALGWWSYKAHRQREAVAALAKIGAYTGYDHTLPWNNDAEWPGWVMSETFRDYFANPLYVSWSQQTLTVADLEPLRDVPMIQLLQLQYSDISDDGLRQLKALSSLSLLNLHDTNISDAGLEHLKGLTELRDLDLRSTNVTDAGVAGLQKALPNCKIEH